MCCGNGGGGRTSTQSRRRTNTQTRVAGGSGTWRVTLPDGTVHSGLSEHQALVLTLDRGGGMEPEPAQTAQPAQSATPS